MQNTVEAQLLLAEKRHKIPPGSQTSVAWLVCNDCILDGGQLCDNYRITGETFLLLPYIGDLQINASFTLEETECYLTSNPGSYRIQNPYAQEAVNFLAIGIQGRSRMETPQHINLTLEVATNQLIRLAEGIFIGQWDGRQNGTFTPSSPKHEVFVFVIDGAFEVQNRLLHPRDGLLLSQVSTIEFEALSPKAILLIVENLSDD
jgi:hypothetical protein